MKHLTIGTAGHVDHGKTRLTIALTGTDTDRLEEEKRRGLTIDIGFARMELPGGQTVSIVDVPGHERFIRNMAAGASGIDAVLMTVAADDGVMPQTMEHLEILEMLGVREGIIVVTKKDLADEDWLRAVEEEIREKMKGSFLENAPLYEVSSVTGEGIRELREGIAGLFGRTSSRITDSPFRLPVDRVFTLSGSGVIVTGTVTDGSARKGGSFMLYPQEKTVRIRELRSHDVSLPCVEAGMRAAASLSGAEVKEIARGSVLAEAGSVRVAGNAAVLLRVGRDAPFSVKNSSRLHFYVGTQELLARVRLLDRDELRPGEQCFAQFFFEGNPALLRIMDRYVVRFYSPLATVGGGIILDVNEKRLKRGRPEILDGLRSLLESADERVLRTVRKAGERFVSGKEISLLLGMTLSGAEDSLRRLAGEGRIRPAGDGYLSEEVYRETGKRAEEILREYHAREPLSEGMPLGEFREKLFGNGAGSRQSETLLDMLSRDGTAAVSGNAVSAGGFSVTFSAGAEAFHRELLDEFRGFGYMPPPLTECESRYEKDGKPFGKMLRLMEKRGEIVRLGDGYAVAAETLEAAKHALLKMFGRQEFVTLGQFRTELDISRKYAALFLEYFDRLGITKREGEARIKLF